MSANVGEALYKELTTDAGVAALVSTRVYPRMIPQDASLPACAYQLISNVPEHSHSPGRSDFWRARYQITCTALTYDGASDLAEAVTQALDGFRGILGGMVSGSSCFVENVLDSSEMGPAVLENSVRVDVAIYYQEV